MCVHDETVGKCWRCSGTGWLFIEYLGGSVRCKRCEGTGEAPVAVHVETVEVSDGAEFRASMAALLAVDELGGRP